MPIINFFTFSNKSTLLKQTLIKQNDATVIN